MRVPLRSATRRSDAEDGAVAILMAVCTIILVAVLAFLTDFGLAYANKQALQSGVDAASLAAGRHIAEKALPNQTCDSIEAGMEDSAAAIVQEYFALNGTAADAAVGPGPNGYIECNDNALMVSVVAAQTSPYILGTPFVEEGSDGIALKSRAKAAVGPAGSALGIRPFAICKVDAEALEAAYGQAYNIVLDNRTNRGCGVASGNFGLMDLDGGANGTPQVREWILNGYEREISAAPPTVLEGGPGDTGGGALDAQMDTVIGEDVVLPVFDSVVRDGANARYTISGFISVEICGFDFAGRRGIGGCFDSSAEPDPGRNSYLQVTFKRLIAVGELNTSCEIGAPCDRGARVVKLAQ